MGVVVSNPDIDSDDDITSWAAVTRASGFDAFAATPSSANLRALVTDESGSGALLFANGALGTPSSGVLTNATGLPISTGVAGLGTGVATALAVNVGSAGAPVVNGGALGTPSSGTLTNATGLPVATGISGLGSGQAAFLAAATSSAHAHLPIRERLSANRTYYVDHALGSNSNTGLSAGSGNAWATISYAWSFVRDWVDLNGYQVVIQIADGTFDEIIICSGVPTGYRDLNSIIIRGNLTTNANCFNNHAGVFPCVSVYENTFVRFEGMKFANPSGTDHCFKVYRGASAEIAEIVFGACGEGCLQAADGSITLAARGSATANIEFVGNAKFGVVIEVGNGLCDFTSGTVTFTGSPAFSGHPNSAFINCGEGGYYGNYSTTYSGAFTGRKYYNSDNGNGLPLDKLEDIPGSLEGVWTHPVLSAPQGRLTLENGVPVSSTDQAAKSTLHYDAYLGDYGVFSYGGEDQYEMVTIGAAGLSLALDADSGHTGYHQADKNFDVFLIRIVEAFYIATGPAWTNDTTRAAAISRPNGVLANTSSMVARFGTGADDTNTCAAGSAVYVGTIRTTGSDGQTEDSLTKRFVWNAYNRRPRTMRVTEATDTWTYNTFAWRQANGSTANQLAFVRGIDEDEVASELCANVKCDTMGADIGASIGLDATNARVTGVLGGFVDVLVAGYRHQVDSKWRGFPGLGYHYLAWIELSEGGGPTTTFEGDAGSPTFVQSGLQAMVWA